MFNDQSLDREFDATIAEHVMGWRWFSDNIGYPDYIILLDPTTVRHPAFKMVDAKHNRFLDWDTYVPHYSTNITDAWLVVDEMHRRGNHLSLIYTFNQSLNIDHAVWQATFQLTKPLGEANTPALAICRAALNVVKW
jgi:hypothetical protein